MSHENDIHRTSTAGNRLQKCYVERKHGEHASTKVAATTSAPAPPEQKGTTSFSINGTTVAQKYMKGTESWNNTVRDASTSSLASDRNVFAKTKDPPGNGGSFAIEYFLPY